MNQQFMTWHSSTTIIVQLVTLHLHQKHSGQGGWKNIAGRHTNQKRSAKLKKHFHRHQFYDFFTWMKTSNCKQMRVQGWNSQVQQSFIQRSKSDDPNRKDGNYTKTDPRNNVFWLNITKDNTPYIEKCTTCEKTLRLQDRWSLKRSQIIRFR